MRIRLFGFVGRILKVCVWNTHSLPEPTLPLAQALEVNQESPPHKTRP